jgi:hypothetical protein
MPDLTTPICPDCASTDRKVRGVIKTDSRYGYECDSEWHDAPNRKEDEGDA